MSARTSVFGSKSEERGFRSIERTWGDGYAIYPQFPWSALFAPDPKWTDTSNFFFKTSVDYVFCEKSGRPLLAIDFDGMGCGYDRNGKYVQAKSTSDRNRKAKFDFKLRYARDSGFPYYIVSSEEFSHLGNDGVQLTVVDGIIGSTLARQAYDERVQSYLEKRVNALYNLMELDPSTPDALKPVRSKVQLSGDLQFMAKDLETDCAVEFNPFCGILFRLWSQIEQIVGDFPGGGYRHSGRRFQDPPFPDIDLDRIFRGDDVDLHDLHRRAVEARTKVELRGCIVTLENTPVGEVSEVVTIRNVAHSETLVGEIAVFMAYCKLLRLLRRGMESQKKEP